MMQKNIWLAALGTIMLAACANEIIPASGEQASSESEILRKNGYAQISNGKEKEAVATFDQLIALDPQNAMAYNGKAVAFDYSGNHLAAQELYRTALSLDPDSMVIKNNLAMSLILNHQTDQATTLLESLLNVKSDAAASNTIRHNLALAYGISGQLEKANQLNLRDLTPQQAKENIRFYEKYIKSTAAPAKKDGRDEITSPKNNRNIGFMTSSGPSPVKPGKDAVAGRPVTLWNIQPVAVYPK